jgi:hypothetical protein
MVILRGVYVNNPYYDEYILMAVDLAVLLLTVIHIIVFVLVTPCSLACGYHLGIRIYCVITQKITEYTI